MSLRSWMSISLAFVALPMLAFKPAVHVAVTSGVLTGISVSLGGQTLQFTNDAMTQIGSANSNTDFCASCQFDSSRHFDSEDFAGGSGRLRTLKESIISKITNSSPDGSSARDDLGTALHTVQDFYSHSNWSDRFSGINSQLGRLSFGPGDPGPPQVADLTTPTCPTEPGTLGGAGLTSVTTGYFSIPLVCSFPTGKCSHGGFLTCPNTGISKDFLGRTGFLAAETAATSATSDFINQILNYNGEPLASGTSYPAVTGNMKAIKALMGLQSSTLGFVIDTTGSMGDIIGQVKSQVGQIVNSVLGTPNEPSQYLLQGFNDPTIDAPVTTGNASTFLTAVNALGASGGGDCPELAMTGLLSAIQAADPDATLFFFSDASAKDSFLAGNVVAAAVAKRILINFLLFGSCSPVDPGYTQVASQTGGQLFFLQRSEAGSTFTLVKPQLGGHPVGVLSSTGTLSGTTRTFTIPIDSSVTSATFSISVDVKGAITLTRPDGTTVATGQPGVTLTNVSSGELITVDKPPPGNWTLQIGGSGSFSVSVIANSSIALARGSIELNTVEFVQLGGRIGHEGLFPIPGQPVTGSAQTLLARLTGPFQTATFSLLSATGDPIQGINLLQGNPDTAATDFVGTITLPSQPFRVAVTGNDTNGVPYQRIFPELFKGQSVLIAAVNPVDTLPIGNSTLTFSVQNLGAAQDTFRLTAADNCGIAVNCHFVSGVTPGTLTLAPGASGNALVNINVPSGTLPRTLQVTATATSTSNPAVTNSATELLTISGLDTTPPTTTAAASPAPNVAGWNKSDVTVTLSSIDNPGGSGVKQIQTSLTGAQTGSTTVSGSTASITITAEGTTVLTFFATDNAGNKETPRTVTVRIDKTTPVISGMPAAGCSLWPPNHKFVQAADVTATDVLSGLAPGSFKVTGTSNEPSDPNDPDIVITPDASGGFTVQLRSDRDGNGNGRIYTLTATAADLAGNVANVTATCTVPHDQGRK